MIDKIELEYRESKWSAQVESGETYMRKWCKKTEKVEWESKKRKCNEKVKRKKKRQTGKKKKIGEDI